MNRSRGPATCRFVSGATPTAPQSPLTDFSLAHTSTQAPTSAMPATAKATAKASLSMYPLPWKPRRSTMPKRMAASLEARAMAKTRRLGTS